MSNRIKGWVVFYHRRRGFGRIKPVNGGDTIHVHYTGLIGCNTLHKGQIVWYTASENEHGPIAIEVEVQNAKTKTNTGTVSHKAV